MESGDKKVEKKENEEEIDKDNRDKSIAHMDYR